MHFEYIRLVGGRVKISFPSNHRLLMADPRLLNPAEKTKANVMNEKLTDVIDNKGRWEKRIDL